MATVIVAGESLALGSEAGGALIEDIARYTEGLLDDDDLRAAWGMSPDELTALKNNPDVFDAARSTKYRREQDGSAARERARKAFVKAPRVLEHILDDPHTPTRAKIEAARELRASTGLPSEQSAKGGGELFQVTINLGADVPPFKFAAHTRPPPNVDVIDLQDLPPVRDRVLIPPVSETDDDDN